jgi:hypothetical protein
MTRGRPAARAPRRSGGGGWAAGRVGIALDLVLAAGTSGPGGAPAGPTTTAAATAACVKNE